MIHAILLAQAANGGQQQPDWGQSLFQMMPILFMVLLGYFLLWKPIRRQESERKAMVATLKKNARVLTSGGFIGKILHIKDDEEIVLLKLDEGKISVTKGSIVRVLADGEAKESAGGEE
jgi:preprotein translocase subunit YajC